MRPKTGSARTRAAGDHEVRRPVIHQAPAGHQVTYLPAAQAEHIGEQAAMATPPLRFGTHDGHAAPRCQVLQPGEAVGELRRAQMVGVAAEPGDPPAVVARAGGHRPPAAQGAEVLVGDPVLGQRAGQRVGAVLWMSPRAREPAHVGHLPHSALAQ
jgi:hypothetical protein